MDDRLWSQGAGVWAVAVNDTTYTLGIRPGEREGDAATFTVEPASDFYTIENSVHTSAHGSEEKLAVAREPGSRTIRVSGTMPAGAPPRRVAVGVEGTPRNTPAPLTRAL